MSSDPERLLELRRRILKMAADSGEGHVPSAFSVLEVVREAFRFFEFGPGKDDFILSKGHASLALFVVLAEIDLVSESDLAAFCSFDARLGGHPDATKVPLVPTSTGSLGHGLPFGVGLAAAKVATATNPGNVVVLIGDGESNEGTTWEAALLAAKYGLPNLICILDNNQSVARAVGIDPIREKWSSFGWQTFTVDGHDQGQISHAFQDCMQSNVGPKMIIANTVKGKGVPRMENNPAWHHTKIEQEMLESLLLEVSW